MLQRAVAMLLVVHCWTSHSDAHCWPAPAEGLAASKKKSVHAAVFHVAAGCGRGTTRRYQTARGCPMSACWSPRTTARSRVPHLGSISDDGNRLAAPCSPVFRGCRRSKLRPRPCQCSIDSPFIQPCYPTVVVPARYSNRVVWNAAIGRRTGPPPADRAAPWPSLNKEQRGQPPTQRPNIGMEARPDRRAIRKPTANNPLMSHPGPGPRAGQAAATGLPTIAAIPRSPSAMGLYPASIADTRKQETEQVQRAKRAESASCTCQDRVHQSTWCNSKAQGQS